MLITKSCCTLKKKPKPPVCMHCDSKLSQGLAFGAECVNINVTIFPPGQSEIWVNSTREGTAGSRPGCDTLRGLGKCHLSWFSSACVFCFVFLCIHMVPPKNEYW